MIKEELERIKQAYYSGLKVQIWFNGHWENFDARDYSMYSDPFSENRLYRIVGSAYADIAEKRIVKLEKENAELKEENKKSNVLFADIIEAFASRSYNDDFEMAQAGKEIYELFYGGKGTKEVFHNAEVPKSSRQLLKEAKEIVKEVLDIIANYKPFDDSFINKAEQFLKESE